MVRNLFGGLVVIFEKPARLGDVISVGKLKGRVAAQRLRTTVLSDDGGRNFGRRRAGTLPRTLRPGPSGVSANPVRQWRISELVVGPHEQPGPVPGG